MTIIAIGITNLLTTIATILVAEAATGIRLATHGKTIITTDIANIVTATTGINIEAFDFHTD